MDALDTEHATYMFCGNVVGKMVRKKNNKTFWEERVNILTHSLHHIIS